jgi:hypothetical protein
VKSEEEKNWSEGSASASRLRVHFDSREAQPVHRSEAKPARPVRANAGQNRTALSTSVNALGDPLFVRDRLFVPSSIHHNFRHANETRRVI